MKTSLNGVKFISKWEGTKLKSYKDSVGIWTIGVGHTSAAGLPNVTSGMTITKDESDDILSKDLKAVEKQVLSLVKVPLTQNQFDVLVSFVFNVGSGNFSKSSVLSKLNAKDYKGAAESLLLYNKGTVDGKKVFIQGLANRRADEKKLFLTPDDVTIVTIEVTQTPVAVEPTKPAETVITVETTTVTEKPKSVWVRLLELVLKALK